MLSWLSVQSSAIKAIAYQDKSLYARFTSGREYEYKDVPLDVYQAFLDTPSKGRYLNSVIKEHYTYKRL